MYAPLYFNVDSRVHKLRKSCVICLSGSDFFCFCDVLKAVFSKGQVGVNKCRSHVLPLCLTVAGLGKHVDINSTNSLHSFIA